MSDKSNGDTILLPTMESWDEFLEENDSGKSFLGYIEATKDITLFLKRCTSSSKDFDQLKKDLTSFIDERESFVNYAEKHMP